MAAQQSIRFATAAGGVRLACTRSGGRSPVPVKAVTWRSHLEFDGDSPVWRHSLHALAQRTGADRPPPWTTLRHAMPTSSTSRKVVQ